MATVRRNIGIVYRLGRRTANNFTPKAKDLAGRIGLREPGLSTLDRLGENEEGIKIDLSLLKPPLQAFADDPESQGRPGHLSIGPVSESGMVDLGLLQDWIESRDRGFNDPLTQIVLDAAIAGKVKGPT